jgi:hypothetical protein
MSRKRSYFLLITSLALALLLSLLLLKIFYFKKMTSVEIPTYTFDKSPAISLPSTPVSPATPALSPSPGLTLPAQTGGSVKVLVPRKILAKKILKEQAIIPPASESAEKLSSATAPNQNEVKIITLEALVSPEIWDLSWGLHPFPDMIDLYLGNPPSEYDLGQIIPSRTLLNGRLPPASHEVLSSYGKFSGPVLHFRYQGTEAIKSLHSLSGHRLLSGEMIRIEITGPLVDREKNVVALFKAEGHVTVKDKIPPFTTATLAPAPNLQHWNNTPVNLIFKALDSVSGVKETRYRFSIDGGNSWSDWTIASPVEGSTSGGSPYESSGGSYSSDGFYLVEYRSIDMAGNEEPSRPQTIKIDLSPPVIRMRSFLKSYPYNSLLSLTYETADKFSGVEGSQATFNGATVKNGTSVTLNHPGINSFAVTTIDQAGNHILQRGNFFVQYRFIGFLPPISKDGKGLFEMGSTLPVSFQITDSVGAAVPNAEASISAHKISREIPSGESLDASPPGKVDEGEIFRYDPFTNQYLYNMSTETLSAGTWRIDVTLDDGSIHSAFFSLK